MNRLDAWMLRGRVRQLAFWLGFLVPLSVVSFVVALTTPNLRRRELVFAAAPVIFVVAITRAWRVARGQRA